MRINSHLFDAFLKCATKCHLRSIGEIGSGNEYAEWVRAQDEAYQRDAALRLTQMRIIGGSNDRELIALAVIPKS